MGNATRPSLGTAKPTGAPSISQYFQMLVNHGAISASPVTRSCSNWSLLLASARMFLALSIQILKPGSMFFSSPPFRRAASTSGMKLLSKNVTLLRHLGFQRSVHDVGGSLTRFLLYMYP